MFYHALLACHFVVYLDLFLTRWLFTCMQHIRRLTRVQHTKHYSRASYYHAHKVLLVCSAQNIVHMQYTKVDSHAAHFVSQACFDWVTRQNWRTHMCSSRQLRRQLYGKCQALLTCMIYSVPSIDSDTLFSIVKGTLVMLNLPLSKVTGQCYDGTQWQ